MKHLYCPWREDYTANNSREDRDKMTTESCVFCNNFKQTDDENNFILRRFKHNAIMFNRFPYNAGHLLILPLTHDACLTELSKEAREELMELVTQSIEILKKILNCHGINIGFNLGKAAGASIPNHLHMHVLPRFNGDTNFLPTFADTKAISFDLHDLYNKLKPEFDKI